LHESDDDLGSVIHHPRTRERHLQDPRQNARRRWCTSTGNLGAAPAENSRPGRRHPLTLEAGPPRGGVRVHGDFRPSEQSAHCHFTIWRPWTSRWFSVPTILGM
jgi:hypothetical protein